MQRSVSQSNRYKKEICVWLDQVKRSEEEFISSIPELLGKEEDNYLPIRNTSTQHISNNKLDESKLREQDDLQTHHADVVSARKLRDYYSKWDKFDKEPNSDTKSTVSSQKSETQPSKPTKLMEVTAANKKKAEAEKELGNKHFKDSEWKKAIEAYSNAMILDPLNVVYPLNRSMALIKTKEWNKVIEDTNLALTLDPNSAKAYFRKSTALFQLQMYDQASECIKKTIQLSPKDSAAKSLLKKINEKQKVTVKPQQVESKKIEPLSNTTKTEDSSKGIEKSNSKQQEQSKPKVAELLNPISTKKLSNEEQINKETELVKVEKKEEIQEEISNIKVDKEDNKSKNSFVITPLVPTKAPISLFEFEKNFVNLKGFPELFYKYLQVCSIIYQIICINILFRLFRFRNIQFYSRLQSQMIFFLLF